MNRERMRTVRRARQSRVHRAIHVQTGNTLLTIARTVVKAKDRIDHHDEKLGITRPIDSWRH